MNKNSETCNPFPGLTEAVFHAMAIRYDENKDKQPAKSTLVKVEKVVTETLHQFKIVISPTSTKELANLVSIFLPEPTPKKGGDSSSRTRRKKHAVVEYDAPQHFEYNKKLWVSDIISVLLFLLAIFYIYLSYNQFQESQLTKTIGQMGEYIEMPQGSQDWFHYMTGFIKGTGKNILNDVTLRLRTELGQRIQNIVESSTDNVTKNCFTTTSSNAYLQYLSQLAEGWWAGSNVLTCASKNIMRNAENEMSQLMFDTQKQFRELKANWETTQYKINGSLDNFIRAISLGVYSVTYISGRLGLHYFSGRLGFKSTRRIKKGGTKKRTRR